MIIGTVTNSEVYHVSIDYCLWLSTTTPLVDLTSHCVADDLRQITQKDFRLNNRHVDWSLENKG